mmetsp:Transcript_8825/g.26425  ORF Transcript_8825/g.26425 Transcript_8825/m.26425 type:complete len:603 (+) Transcript_8825:130-1938(+)
MSKHLACTIVDTKPFDGQKPGTSGLRKKVKEFEKEHYLANFIQSTFDALPDGQLTGSTLVVSGDGRYYSVPAIQIIAKLAAANGVGKLWVGVGGLMSTPAVSAVIRNRHRGEALGAFILTASHNPGGPNEDFGVKYNCENGGPAPEKLTDAIFENTKIITRYSSITELPELDVSKPGRHSFFVQHAAENKFGQFEVEVIDPVEDYLKLLRTIFDFASIKAFLARADFSFTFDGLSGVAGPYAHRILGRELGVPAAALVNCEPLPDFGGHHPDPNLTYARHLVNVMGLGTTIPGHVPHLGAACDGDADRNMILGSKFFVTPSDSVAIIAAHAAEAIPYFKGGVKGVARSMPTSAALDRVAEAKGIACYEVPTGWKFFGNLMDAGKCSICGEESFGTGSDHIREKDGLWAVLAWLSILAHVNKDQNRSLYEKVAKAAPGLHLPGGGDKQTKQLVTVEQVVKAHWAQYGRNFYQRYDYEGVDADKANKVMTLLESKMGEITQFRSLKIVQSDQFTYHDPVDGSVAKNQGARFVMDDGSRFVFRLSGTGSSGATIRMYVEKYVAPEAGEEALGQDTSEAVAPLVKAALAMSDLVHLTGRKEPTVIT